MRRALIRALAASPNAPNVRWLIPCALLSAAASVRADPLNPLDFPSLGTQTIAAGSYNIDTGATPPTFGAFVGTVSPSGVAVFRFDDLTVNSGASITVIGGLVKRPIALLASGNLTYGGSILARGTTASNGSSGGAIGGPPGAGSGGMGGAGGAVSTLGVGGFGGGLGGGAGAIFGNFGSGGGFGGAGGFASGSAGGVNGVQPNFQLGGGSGGGGGIGLALGGGGGGGGGGAVELGALGLLSIAGTASINVDGGNGGSSPDVRQVGGGGSGGAILLHGRSVTFGTTGNAISAAGGNSGAAGNGSSGGGGRVAIQTSVINGASGISVAGGTSGTPGFAGVITVVQPTLTPTNLDFGSIPVGSSITLGMIVQNTGAAGSFINGQFPAAAAPFARVGAGTFSDLKQNAYTACPYTFTPAAPGPFSQTLNFLSNGGNTQVTISGVGVSTAPANDSCAAAIRIGDGARSFSTVGATTDGPTEANLGFCCSDPQVNQDVWFLYTATCTGTASVSLCGSSYDSKVAVYSGATCPSAPNTAIAGNDDAPANCGTGSLQSFTTFACTAGSQYLIRVGGYTTNAGNAQMAVGCVAAPPPCAADFNHSGIVSVQDIFDFLAAYFTGCP
jgi:hypothetical protein